MSFPTDPKIVVSHRHEGAHVMIRESRCSFKLTGHDTNGKFGLFEYEMAPNALGAAPHVHGELLEIFYVVEGEVELLAGEQRVTGRTGSLVSVPPKTVHAFANMTSEPAIILIMFCPADTRERYFEGLAELTKDGRRPARDELVALMRRFDQEPVDNIAFP